MQPVRQPPKRREIAFACEQKVCRCFTRVTSIERVCGSRATKITLRRSTKMARELLCAHGVIRERAAKRRARVFSSWLLAWMLAVASTCAQKAGAQEEARAIEGHVVAVQDEDIIVDLAGARGAK